MDNQSKPEGYITISDYLDSINESLNNFHARVIGEVTDIQLYPDRNYLFFKIKDKTSPAVMTCIMWKREYSLSGVDLQIGTEVIVSGVPSIHKPLGRFSFQAKTLELVGEGQLKKAYDQLKARLEKEGLLSDARKRPLPKLPQRIGLITSKDGAAIGDFQANLGHFGFSVIFIDSRVEGQQAVPELLGSIRTLKKQDIDVLVLIRGGGSLESLLPFNNEALVREVVDFPVPVLVGVGHEKDISLLGLVADKMVSTPTAAAQSLSESWQKAAIFVQFNAHKIFTSLDSTIDDQQLNVRNSFQVMRDQLQIIFNNCNISEQAFFGAVALVRSRISELHKQCIEYPNVIGRGMQGLIKRTRTHISTMLYPIVNQLKYAIDNGRQIVSSIEKNLESNNPERQLRLGYSITKLEGTIVRHIGQLKKGQSVETRFQDGTASSDIKEIKKAVQ